MKILTIVLLLTLINVNSCHYSPWETDIDCQDNYSNNLSNLKTIESNLTGNAFSIAIITDIHVDLTSVSDVINRINQRNDISFVLVLGDITNFGLAAEFEWVCKAMKKLHVPRFYAIGNHDSISFGKEIFRENFAPYDYAFTFKDVKFIVYNDNAFEFPGVPDYSFLGNAATIQPGETRRRTLAIAHSPPVKDSHSESEAVTLRQFLSDNGIDLTLHGHFHEFDYWSDEFGTLHHITARIKNSRYSILDINESSGYTIQNCATSCNDAILR